MTPTRTPTKKPIGRPFDPPSRAELSPAPAPVPASGAAGEAAHADEAAYTALRPDEPHTDCDADPIDPLFPGFNKWTYSLHFDLPSRMASAKNVMGSSVTIVTDYQAPDTPVFTGVWASAPVFPPSSPPGPSDTTFPRIVVTTGSNQGGIVDTWNYTLEAGPDNYLIDPGYPFTACEDAACSTTGTPKGYASSDPLDHVGTFTVRAPSKVIAKNKDVVNWGLLTYKGASPYDISCATAVIEYLVKIEDHIVPVDDHDVTAIEGYMMLVADGGVSPSGPTPTKAALDAAVTAHQDTFAVDPLYRCNRLYGSILITDGLSNMCNLSGDNGDWFATCDHFYPEAICFAECVDGSGNPAADTLPCTLPNVPNPYFQKCCDGDHASGYDCNDPDPPATPNNNYTEFAAGPAENAWNLNLQRGTPLLPDPPLQVRTFVIGISSIVGPCEVNRIAYRGRTDAALPDFGVAPDPVKNIYLPPNAFEFQTVNHANYATFADSPDQLADALDNIVKAGGTGDYTTNSPVGGGVGGGDPYSVLLASVEYPEWNGHFYNLDLTKLVTDPTYVKWDAGVKLKAMEPTDRKIYTWDPSNNNALVRIDYTQTAALSAIAGVPIDAKTVDFIIGYDGTGTGPSSTGAKRSWVLGGIINSTPAIVPRPQQYSSLSVQNHTAFEAVYQNRNRLIWIGADDGMFHAFSADDGREVLALLPPNLLQNQVSFLSNYVADTKQDRPTGQASSFSSHIYGPANSMRFLDVYFPDETPDPTYKTVGIITEGPGGNLVAAIDITHPTGPDPSAPVPAGDVNYGMFGGVNTGEPVQVLWTRTGGSVAPQISTLFDTWSVPSFAPVTADKWRLILGAGFNAASTQASPVAPKAFVLDMVDGSLQPSSSPAPLDVTNDAAHTPWVGNQTFSDTVFIDTDAPAYSPDDRADLGLVPDLNGRIWFVSGTAPDFDTFQIGIDASKYFGQSQPIYYSPAASGYGPRGTGCDLITFGSGTFYEQSTQVTGNDIGDDDDAYFQPSLYLTVKPKGVSTVDSSPGDPHIAKLRLREIDRPTGDPQGPGKLGRHSQVVSPPFILVPPSGIGVSEALFLIFDPDAGCLGRSYVVRWKFTATSCEVQPQAFGDLSGDSKVYDIGSGATSGFALVGGKVIAAKSDPVQAHVEDPGIEPLPITEPPHLVPTWWRELK